MPASLLYTHTHTQHTHLLVEQRGTAHGAELLPLARQAADDTRRALQEAEEADKIR